MPDLLKIRQTALASRVRRFTWPAMLAFVLVALSSPVSAGEPKPNATQIIYSKVVCAPGTHSNCKPGPFSTEVLIPGTAFVNVHVYLHHSGNYEENEQSWFYSELGDILDCGPIPEGEEELYCGKVSGRVDTKLTFTVEHSGGGDETGSHKQRYQFDVFPDQVFLPFVSYSP